MNTYCKLCRHFFLRFRTALYAAAAALLAAELVIFLFMAASSTHAYEPFESVIEHSWLGPMFVAALAILCLYITLRFLDDFVRDSRAIYTLMTLPGPSWAVPLAWATTLLAAVCLLAGLQLALVFVLYVLHSPLQSLACQFYQADMLRYYRLNDWSFPQPGLRNGLSYAFLRSTFLRALLPLHADALPLWLARLLLPPALGTACLGMRRWRRLPLLLCAAGLLAFLHIRCLSGGTLWAAAALALEIILLAGVVRSFHRARNLP